MHEKVPKKGLKLVYHVCCEQLLNLKWIASGDYNKNLRGHRVHLRFRWTTAIFIQNRLNIVSYFWFWFASSMHWIATHHNFSTNEIHPVRNTFYHFSNIHQWTWSSFSFYCFYLETCTFPLKFSVISNNFVHHINAVQIPTERFLKLPFINSRSESVQIQGGFPKMSYLMVKDGPLRAFLGKQTWFKQWHGTIEFGICTVFFWK